MAPQALMVDAVTTLTGASRENRKELLEGLNDPQLAEEGQDLSQFLIGQSEVDHREVFSNEARERRIRRPQQVVVVLAQFARRPAETCHVVGGQAPEFAALDETDHL